MQITFTLILFLFFAACAIGCALAMITRKNPVACAMWLIGTFFSVAAIYTLLGAFFIGIVQILVYAGAIMVLFLFVVMLLNAPHEDTEHDLRVHPLLRAGPMGSGVVLAVMLVVELGLALAAGRESGSFPGGSVGSVRAIGRTLFTDYAFPFEVTSVLILVAMVGAVVLAKREPR